MASKRRKIRGVTKQKMIHNLKKKTEHQISNEKLCEKKPLDQAHNQKHRGIDIQLKQNEKRRIYYYTI